MSKKKVKSTPKKKNTNLKNSAKKTAPKKVTKVIANKKDKKVANNKVKKKAVVVSKKALPKTKLAKPSKKLSNTKTKPSKSNPVKAKVSPKSTQKKAQSGKIKSDLKNNKPAAKVKVVSKKIEPKVLASSTKSELTISKPSGNHKPEVKVETTRPVLARTFTEKKKKEDSKPTIGKLVQEKVKASASIDAPSVGTSYANVSKPGEQKNLPEPKGKFELEYVVHSSTSILYEFLTSPSGLSEWFCDDVNIRNGIYSFIWDGSVQMARLVRQVEDKLIRFQWTEKNDGSFFEFRIERDDLTNDISLIVTDFADTPEEKASSKLLWDSQIEKLLQVLGSHF